MTKRMLLVALAAILLFVGGLLAYRYRAQAAADCGDKPKPKDEFTLAEPCDTGTEAAPKAPAAATPR